jgi:hypothetical protein
MIPNSDDDDTEPPSISLDVHDVLTLAAEIAADEGHSATISTDNVQEAFEALVEEAKDGED